MICAQLHSTLGVDSVCWHVGRITQITYAANDDVLVTAGYDQCIRIWDCKSRSFDAMQVMKAFKVSRIIQ